MSSPSTQAVHALRRGAMTDPFTCSLFACAPYRGCGHGCAYCDGRAEKYYVEGDFEKDIVTRPDLPEQLARELPTLREWGAVSFGSGVTDAYQPCEEGQRLTRRLAAALAEMPDQRGPGGLGPLPAVILTKSARILEDAALWSQVNTRAAVMVMVSITSLDERFREAFEPEASPFQARLEVLQRFKAMGFLTGALVMPLLPGITDDVASMRPVFERLKAIDVDFAMAGGLTLRPGRQKEHFLQVLHRHRPDLEGFYADLYREARPSGAPLWVYRSALMRRMGEARQGLELPWLLPHDGLRRLMEPPDELAVLFWQMEELFRARGVDTAPLAAARRRYEQWLKARRTDYRRRRTLPIGWLPCRLEEAATTGELAGVLDNPKLAEFAKRVVMERQLLDSVTLKLGAG